MCEGLNKIHNLVNLLIIYAEFIFGKAGCDICVCVRSHVRIYAQSHTCHHVTLSSKSLYGLELGDRLHIKAEDTCVEGKSYLFIGFTHTCKNYSIGRDTRSKSRSNLTAAYTVGSQACLAYNLQQARIKVGFHRIVNVKALVLAGLALHRVERSLQKVNIIIVKRRLDTRKRLYRESHLHQTERLISLNQK